MEDILSRLEKLEKNMENIKKQIRKKAKKQKLTLQEKFYINDSAQNLLREYEVMESNIKTTAFGVPATESILTIAHKEELKTIIKCYNELIDHALGVEFP